MSALTGRACGRCSSINIIGRCRSEGGFEANFKMVVSHRGARPESCLIRSVWAFRSVTSYMRISEVVPQITFVIEALIEEQDSSLYNVVED